MSAMSLEVVDPGLLATVQDAGRSWSSGSGLSAAGAADGGSLRIANLLLGNDPAAAAIEVTGGPLRVRVLDAGTLAVAGGEAALTEVRGAAARGATGPAGSTAAGSTLTVPAGSIVVVTPGPGLRAYLAAPGGLDVPEVLGSRSTDLRAGFGGLDGRALRPGDRLRTLADPRHAGITRPDARWPAPAPDRLAPLHVVEGPHAALLGEEACRALAATTWCVGAASDRMGLRLEGDPVTSAAPGELPSLGVHPGVIQVPPDGRPIILLPDAQPTGGYPVIGVVAAADRPVLGQLRPGDPLRLCWIERDAAVALRRSREAAVAAALAVVREAAGWDELWQSAQG